ncbi:MAG: DNA mismatch endonuclease Vsr [Gammaproteobacteria bacterium]|nr:DNA mismatch endonuclease Vsr [Gammaproteobacteria bacterium]
MDIVDSGRRSKMMAAIGHRNTQPELIVRRIAHRMGLRYRIHVRNLPGCPDMVLPRHRTVIFVHGCFWHRHKDCANAATPKTRTEFWTSKFQQNISRDARAVAALEALGWRTMIIWECETGDAEKIEGRLMDAFFH